MSKSSVIVVILEGTKVGHKGANTDMDIILAELNAYIRCTFRIFF